MWSRRALRRLSAATAVTVALLTAQAQLAEAPGARHATGQVQLDAFTATAHEVAQLRRAGAVPVCRLRAAVWEAERPDAGRFPARLVGEQVGPRGQRWLDVRAWPDLAPVLASRLRLCREKGFEVVVLADAGDWTGPAGLGLTTADWHRFEDRVAELAAGHGLALG